MATRPWFVAIDHRLLADDDPEADRTLAMEGVRRALQKGFSLREALLLFGDNLSPQDVRMLANETRGGPSSDSIPEEDHIVSAPNEAADRRGLLYDLGLVAFACALAAGGAMLQSLGSFPVHLWGL
jgi:hypothetical protein